jgi:hypothetical protein
MSLSLLASLVGWCLRRWSVTRSVENPAFLRKRTPFGRKASCAAAWISGEEGGELVGRDETLDLGFVEGSRELLGGQDVGEVDERAGRGGDADAVVGGCVGVG